MTSPDFASFAEYAPQAFALTRAPIDPVGAPPGAEESLPVVGFPVPTYVARDVRRLLPILPAEVVFVPPPGVRLSGVFVESLGYGVGLLADPADHGPTGWPERLLFRSPSPGVEVARFAAWGLSEGSCDHGAVPAVFFEARRQIPGATQAARLGAGASVEDLEAFAVPVALAGPVGGSVDLPLEDWGGLEPLFATIGRVALSAGKWRAKVVGRWSFGGFVCTLARGVGPSSGALRRRAGS